MRNKWIASVMLILCMTVTAMAQNAYQRTTTQRKPSWQQPVRSVENDYGITAGDFMLSVQGGAAFPISSDMQKLSETGYVYGLQAMISATDSFALGLEYFGTHHNGKKFDTGTGPIWETDEIQLDQNNIMLALRMYANPSSRVRFYESLGFGISFARIKDKWEISDLYGSDEGTEKDSYKAFAFYGGLGLEAELAPNFIFGLEGRLNYTRMKKRDIDAVTVSTVARLGYKF